MSFDVSSISPNDAETALRSYPRRFRAALLPIEDDPAVEELAQQVGPDGQSALEHAADAVRSWTVLREAFRQIQVSDTPVVHAAVADASLRQWEAPFRDTVGGLLEQLDDEAVAFADAVAEVSGDQWERRASVAGGGTVTALDVAREAVVVGHDQLGAVERTLAALRR